MNTENTNQYWSSNPNETQEEIKTRIDNFKAQNVHQVLATSLDVQFKFCCWRCGQEHSFKSTEKKEYPIILTVNPSEIVRK